MTDSVFGTPSQAELAATVAEVRVPAKPYVSQQIGCSDLAPLLVAWAVARVGSQWTVFPPRIRAWLELAAARTQRWSEKPVPAEFKGMPAVWCAERARLVTTPVGRIPEIVAVKSGHRQQAARMDYMQAGHDLEAALFNRWVAEEREIVSATYALAGVPAAWRPRFRAPSMRMTDSPLVTYPDGWAETKWGEMAVVNCKTTRDFKEEVDPPAWLQIQGEMAVTEADCGVLPHGMGWVSNYRDDEPTSRPVRAFWIEADRGAQRELVSFSRRAMEWISETAAKGTEQ